MSGAGDRFDEVRARIIGPLDAQSADSTAGLLSRFCGAVVDTLDVSGAGVSMMTSDGVRGVCAASDPHSEVLEELQFTLGEGPCVDAYASRRPVLVPVLADGAMTRWPVYAPTVHAKGLRAVFAFPLQVGGARLGVLDVFRDRAGELTPTELTQAVLLTDVAVAALLDQHKRADDGRAPEYLDEAVERRAELFQAQGMVMVQLGVDIGAAMARIRAYAYAENRRVSDVAGDIVARRLQFHPDHS